MAAAVAALLLAAGARAQSYPVKAVRIVVPAGTPAAIVNKISLEIASAIQLPDVREFMAREGAEPVGSTPQEFAAFFRNEVDRYARVIRSANIRGE